MGEIECTGGREGGGMRRREREREKSGWECGRDRGDRPIQWEDTGWVHIKTKTLLRA